MSFWRTFGFHTVSPVDTLLEKADLTLQELLDEDELLQEVKSQNKRLLEFLTEPDVLTQLLVYLTEDAPPGSDEKRTLKYPFLCCEILCSEVWQINEAFYRHEHLLAQLYSFLERDPPLNPLLSNYCCKVAISLMQRKIAETLDFLRSIPNIVARFVLHLGSPGVNELLMRIVTADDGTGGDVYGSVRWLVESNLVDDLVSLFIRTADGEVHETVSQALIDLVNNTSSNGAHSLILERLETEEISSRLTQFIFTQSGPTPALLHGLALMCELLRRYRGKAFTNTPLDQLPPLIRVLAVAMPQFVALLRQPSEPAETMDMSFGPLKPPVGQHRLQILSTILAMVLTAHSSVFDMMVAGGLLPAVIELFFAYPWNTFLHQTVFEIVVTVLNSPHPPLRSQLIRDSHIVDRILQAEELNQKEIEKWGSRGYMGHLTKISALLIHLSKGDAELSIEADTELAALLDSLPAWKTYVEGPYTERMQNESQLLGGSKPSLAQIVDPEETAEGAILSYNSTFAPFETGEDNDEQGEVLDGSGSDPSQMVFDSGDGFAQRPPYTTEDRPFEFSSNYLGGEDGSSSGSDDEEEGEEDDGEVVRHPDGGADRSAEGGEGEGVGVGVGGEGEVEAGPEGATHDSIPEAGPEDLALAEQLHQTSLEEKPEGTDPQTADPPQ